VVTLTRQGKKSAGLKKNLELASPPNLWRLSVEKLNEQRKEKSESTFRQEEEKTQRGTETASTFSAKPFEKKKADEKMGKTPSKRGISVPRLLN